MADHTPSTGLARPMTGDAVQAITFHESKRLSRGYDEDEVDDFIDRCAADIQALHNRVRQLEAENARLAADLDRATAADPTAAMNTAQRAAASTMKAAEDHREQILAAARATATRLIDDAHRLAIDTAELVANQRDELQQLHATSHRLQTVLRTMLDELDATAAPEESTTAAGGA